MRFYSISCLTFNLTKVYQAFVQVDFERGVGTRTFVAEKDILFDIIVKPTMAESFGTISASKVLPGTPKIEEDFLLIRPFRRINRTKTF